MGIPNILTPNFIHTDKQTVSLHQEPKWRLFIRIALAFSATVPADSAPSACALRDFDFSNRLGLIATSLK